MPALALVRPIKRINSISRKLTPTSSTVFVGIESLHKGSQKCHRWEKGDGGQCTEQEGVQICFEVSIVFNLDITSKDHVCSEDNPCVNITKQLIPGVSKSSGLQNSQKLEGQMTELCKGLITGNLQRGSSFDELSLSPFEIIDGHLSILC